MTTTVDLDGGSIRVTYHQQVCTRCVLPESFPQLTFDEQGLCSYCRNEAERIVVDRDLIATTVADAKAAAASGDYDALVLYSGGKDSSLALRSAVDLGLRTLAFTLDNGFLAHETGRNMANVLDSLNVDHIRFRPPAGLMKRLYRTSMTMGFDENTVKYSTGGCGSCISMVLAAALRTAGAHRIPLLIGGWTPGQFTTSAVVDQAFLTDVMLRHFVPLGEESAELDAALRGWHPDRLSAHAVRLLNPLYASDYTERETLENLAELGWHKPKDTDSCSTNCRLNGLLILDHITRFGFHPYVYELAHHVRIGASTRAEAMGKITELNITTRQVDAVAVELGIPSVLSPAAGGQSGAGL